METTSTTTASVLDVPMHIYYLFLDTRLDILISFDGFVLMRRGSKIYDAFERA